MKKAVIFDIDGVLAKISKNEDGTPKRGYRDYDKVDTDEPIKEMFELLKDCGEFGKTPLFITGRKEKCRKKTAVFLARGFFGRSDFTEDEMRKIAEKSKEFLFMRPDDLNCPAVKLKKEIYEKHIKGNYNVIMAFDDDPEICKMYKEQGILTLQPHTRED